MLKRHSRQRTLLTWKSWLRPPKKKEWEIAPGGTQNKHNCLEVVRERPPRGCHFATLKPKNVETGRTAGYLGWKDRGVRESGDQREDLVECSVPPLRTSSLGNPHKQRKLGIEAKGPARENNPGRASTKSSTTNKSSLHRGGKNMFTGEGGFKGKGTPV